VKGFIGNVHTGTSAHESHEASKLNHWHNISRWSSQQITSTKVLGIFVDYYFFPGAMDELFIVWLTERERQELHLFIYGYGYLH
jgi:hypothetical protein